MSRNVGARSIFNTTFSTLQYKSLLYQTCTNDNMLYNCNIFVYFSIAWLFFYKASELASYPFTVAKFSKVTLDFKGTIFSEFLEKDNHKDPASGFGPSIPVTFLLMSKLWTP